MQLILPWWAIAALFAPTVLDLTGAALRANRIERGTEPRTAQQGASGDAGWLVELYAAHPSGQGHGGRLVDQLIVCVPDDVRLMTAAATPSLAAHYRSRLQELGPEVGTAARASVGRLTAAGSGGRRSSPHQHEPGQ